MLRIENEAGIESVSKPTLFEFVSSRIKFRIIIQALIYFFDLGMFKSRRNRPSMTEIKSVKIWFIRVIDGLFLWHFTCF